MMEGHIHDPLKRQFKQIVSSILYDVIMDIINNLQIKNLLDNILIEHYDKVICWKKDEVVQNYFHLYDVAGDEYFITDPFDN